ncbi:MAG: ubiquinol-cytochrome C chaperone [Sphingomonadales bacterium]|nr:ubiquinol-cytochrome C chaperone [Sphingomonadales bacterium]PIX66500.1 MAG: ubiquinol-cytochrome C chaperone [Sphingomonadales bacterium CG_4_10_14_3_um_filter_58_15]NCO50245.1 ubiquinol-cytochrome C chaperone [Sphingomonadales bacterium]NCP00507.1 ubiquinol-cytochrome C chaperone [Sphingomonadales bacterium]NCP26124.1 ubiquinol-cytochrome C chaperone [Sphingomonadales bacterium]
MSFLSKIFSRDNPNAKMQSLYNAIVSEGRQLGWYEEGQVPDSIDGRFDMIAAIFSLVLIRLEKDDERGQDMAWLTEIFIKDMDGQLRQIGIGDMIVGKHVGRMMGALGGRVGAYREALEQGADLREAIVRNIFRGNKPDDAALDILANRLTAYHAALQDYPTDAVIAGKLPASGTRA